MNRKEVISTTGLLVLALGLFLGSPIEFTTVEGDRYFTLAIGLLILIIILAILYSINGIRAKIFRVTAKLTAGFLALCYFYIGIYAIPLAVWSDHYPMWEDIAIYENSSGDKVIAQFIEVSGALHDYRKMKIYDEYQNNVRFSLRVPGWKMEGRWTKLDLRDSSQVSVELINGQEIK